MKVSNKLHSKIKSEKFDNFEIQAYNSSMQDLYNLMQKKKLTSAKAIFEFCEIKRIEELADTAVEAFIATMKPEQKKHPVSLFNFSASSALSGSNYPCESIACRMKQIEYLAKFSSVYSNSTTIYNPFDFTYFLLDEHGKYEMPPEDFRNEALNAFLISLEYRPLIERNIINFSRTVSVICENCKKEKNKLLDSIEGKLNKTAEKTLFPLLKSELKIEYEKKSIHIAGTKNLIGEDIYLHYEKFPKFMLKNGKRIKSIDHIDFKNPLIQNIIKEAIDSLMLQKLGRIENLTETYLTNNLLEKKLLEEMGKQVETRAINLFAKGLPIIQGLPYEQILKIRDRYADEFKSFQDHVSDLIFKAKNFETQTEFNEFVNNELTSQLKDLKKIQSKGNKNILFKGFANGLFLGASIAVSSILNSDLPSLIGIAKASYDCLDLSIDASEIGERIQKSPLFFYYQIQKDSTLNKKYSKYAN